jgi:hypothetical protein
MNHLIDGDRRVHLIEIENYGIHSIEMIPYCDDFDGVVLTCYLLKKIFIQAGSLFIFP